MALALSRSLLTVIAAQALLAVLVAIVGIHAGLLLHDAVASNVRAGVSSGVGTLGWVLFLPFSLIMGWTGRAYGQGWAGWLFVGTTTTVGLLFVVSTFAHQPVPAAAPRPVADLPCREVVDLVTDHVDGLLPADLEARITQHLTSCDGCTRYLQQLHQVIDAVGHLTLADLPDYPGIESEAK